MESILKRARVNWFLLTPKYFKLKVEMLRDQCETVGSGTFSIFVAWPPIAIRGLTQANPLSWCGWGECPVYLVPHTMSSLKTYSLRSSPRFRPYIPKALTKGKKASARLKGSFQAPNKGERRITIGSYVPGACQDFELHRRKPQVSFF